MTTQSTPAGWYPDPTGKSSQMYWDGTQWHQDQTAPTGSGLTRFSGTQAAVGHAPQQPAGNAYGYKMPILYAIGGLLLPPLVLFLMGGDRKTCLIMLCMWPIILLLMFAFFLGVIPWIGLYIWSAVACHQEAVKQNQAHGFAS